MFQTATYPTLIDRIATQSDSSAGAIRVAAVLFLTALTAAAAQISIPVPFTVVPFTLQPMIVLLGGLALGPRLGASSQVLYLMAGAVGLPVFAASATLPPGALRLLGPTAGYLLSYPVAAWLVGHLARRGFDRRYATSVVAMTAGLLVIYASGATWLSIFAGGAAQSAGGSQTVLATGVYPFFVADIMKLVAAAGILPGFWFLLGPRSR